MAGKKNANKATEGFVVNVGTGTKKEKKNDDFSYEVKQEIATIATRGSWELKLRLLSWNGKEDVYDIRRWKETEDGERCGKGISMSGEELLALRDLLMEAEAE